MSAKIPTLPLIMVERWVITLNVELSAPMYDSLAAYAHTDDHQAPNFRRLFMSLAGCCAASPQQHGIQEDNISEDSTFR
jgi:hypothetical protein